MIAEHLVIVEDLVSGKGPATLEDLVTVEDLGIAEDLVIVEDLVLVEDPGIADDLVTVEDLNKCGGSGGRRGCIDCRASSDC